MKTCDATQIRNPKSQIRNLSRGGFTLVELMVVVVIIGVLAALVSRAIYKAVVTAREAKAVVEINGLASGIAAFKSKYGTEPPSQISIYLTQAGWNTNPASMAIIRNIWPQFDFAMTGVGGTAYPVYWDTAAQTVGGNKVINLNCGECLLFFLGGVMQDAASGPNQVPTGFAKNPRYPFAPMNVSANREGPFFEFTDISRVRDSDGNGFNEWYDSLPGQSRPLLYFSSYEGRGYNVAELPNDGTNYLYLHDVYRVSPTVINPPVAMANAGTGSHLLTAQKPQSFQIISPGYDGDYGQGGVFNPNLANGGLTDSGGNPDKAAFDNLTNFNGGRLNP